MSLMTRAGLLAGAAALTLTSVGFAGTTTDARNDQLIQDLQARIADLERKQGDNWLTEQRASEIRALVHDVLADADTRASLLSSGMTAGYDNGFQIGDTTGNFLLQINGQLQVRWLYNRQRDPQPQLGLERGFLLAGAALPGDGSEYIIGGTGAAGDADLDLAADRHRSGFELPRTKLWFSGHVINPNWQYLIEGDFGQFGTFTLRDAYISHQYGDTGLVITVGQFKLPFLREQLIDSRYQQAVERSLVHQYFTVGRSQGVHLTWEQEMFRIFGAFSDGAHRDNTMALSYGTEWALTGRAEVLLAGNWGQFNEFRSPIGEEFGLLIGAAIHWERDEHGTLTTTKLERLGVTVDGHAKFGALNLFAAYVFSHVDVHTPGITPDDFDIHAIIVQGGFHLTDEWEVFGRYEHVRWDRDLVWDDLHLLTFGVNYYMFNASSHSAKWTTDFGYAFNEVVWGDVRTGWRSDFGDGSRGQFVLRSQIQLAF